VGGVIVYGTTVFIFLLLQSSQNLDLAWGRVGATFIFAYIWPVCTFIFAIYFLILVSGTLGFLPDLSFMHMPAQQPIFFVVVLWPSIWLSLTPGSGLFPYSAISITELDQLGTLMTTLVVMSIRLLSWLIRIVQAHLTLQRADIERSTDIELSNLSSST
jgi:hypothetical protein